MDKNIIQKIILENQELVEQVELVERHFFFEPNGNYVFVGVRQAGKSYLLYQRMKQLIAKGHDIEEMVYINFDDERIANMKSEEMDLIIQAHQALSPKKPILFLEEIQNIEGWEHFARRLANQKYIEVDFYVPSEGLAIQVGYSITDETTCNREMGALQKFANIHEVKKALIVTRDSEQVIKANDMQIEVTPIWKWLLKD